MNFSKKNQKHNRFFANKKRILSTILSTFILTLFFSCEKEVELELNEGTGVYIHGITIISGNNQTTYALTTLTEPLEILVEDANGNVFKNATVEFKVTEGIVTPRVARTDEHGKTKVSWKLGKTVGKQELTIIAKDLTIPDEPLIGAPVIAEATATELPIRVASASTRDYVNTSFDNIVVYKTNYTYGDNNRIILIEGEYNTINHPNILLEYEMGKLIRQSKEMIVRPGELGEYTINMSKDYIYGNNGNIDKTIYTRTESSQGNIEEGIQITTDITYNNGFPTQLKQDHVDLETNNIDEEYLNATITYNNTFNMATVNVKDSGNRTSKKEFEFNDLGQLVEEKYYYNGELEARITFTYDTKNNPYLLLLSGAEKEAEIPQFKIFDALASGVSVANFDWATSNAFNEVLFYPFKNNVIRIELTLYGERYVNDVDYTYNEFEFPISYTISGSGNKKEGTITYENFKDN